MTRQTYTAKVVRTDDGWWAIEVPEFDFGFTQAKRLDQVDHMTRDLIATVLEVEPISFDLNVEYEFGDDVSKLLTRAHDARVRAREAESEARASMRKAASDLSAKGYPQRDIGMLLGVTHQRVAQIIAGVGEDVKVYVGKSRRAPSGPRWRMDDDVSRADIDDARSRARRESEA